MTALLGLFALLMVLGGCQQISVHAEVGVMNVAIDARVCKR